MISVEDHELTKRKILTFLNRAGPSLPVHIAKEVGASALFCSAFLSELLSKKQIKTSFMRVGSSPLYFVPGQEEYLEKSANHLNSREFEAFNSLRENRVLEDSKLEPAMRVALRAIKDFAYPIKVNEKLYWRYFTVTTENAVKKIRLSDSSSSDISESKTEYHREIVSKRVEFIEKPEVLWREEEKIVERPAVVEHRVSQKSEDKKEETVSEKPFLEIKKENVGFVSQNDVSDDKNEEATEQLVLPQNIESPNKEKQIEKKEKEIANIFEKEKLILDSTEKKTAVKKGEKSDFVMDVIEKLKEKDIEIVEEISFKKKEYVAKIRVNSDVGKMVFFGIAKDKKSVTDNDLMVAHQNAQTKKLPALVITFNSLNKKAYEYLEEWGNLVKVLEL